MLSPSLLLTLIYLESVISEENVVITVQGRLQGVAHEGYVSYNGIPYATVNGDAGRFKQGGRAPSWAGIREPYYPNCSPSSDVEECQQLDVHVPTTGSSPWPVLVWVRSSTGQYHPRKLVQRGVIVVVVYYRLGPVGFLCLKEEAIPGNAGAKDVVQALRWVRDNIVAFRGNSDQVVIAGQGSGASVVEATMLSPMAKGLYQGVILQSGTVLSPSFFNYDAVERANALGLMSGDGEDITAGLITTDIADLVANSAKIGKPYFSFGLCVEKKFKKEEQFLTDTPIELFKNKKVHPVPIIIGFNSDEAYIFALNLKNSRVVRRIAKGTRFLLPNELKFFSEGEAEAVARQLYDAYFKKNETMAAVLAYHRDAFFVNHIYRSVRLHASAVATPVYFYQFSHNGSVGIYPEEGIKKTGAAHSDELAYLFSGRDMEDEDGDVQHKLVKLWTNFAKYLTPTPHIGDSFTWAPADPLDTRLLNIGVDMKMVHFPYTKNMQLWDQIYEKYYYSRNNNGR